MEGGHHDSPESILPIDFCCDQFVIFRLWIRTIAEPSFYSFANGHSIGNSWHPNSNIYTSIADK